MAKDSPKIEGKPASAGVEPKTPETSKTPEPSAAPQASATPEPKASETRKLQKGHVRVRALKGVLALEGFFPEGQEFSLDAAEAERREKRGEVELID